MNKVVFEIIGMGSKKYGGFEKYIVEEARQLKELGWKLVVIFSEHPKQLSEQYIKDLHSLNSETIVLHNAPKYKFIINFWKLLRKFKPSIIHTNFSSICLYALPLAIIAGVKKRFATEHCLPGNNSLRLRIIYQLINWMSNFILAVSNRSQLVVKNLVWFGKDKIKTLYLGIEDPYCHNRVQGFDLPIEKEATVLINIAYHNPIKGVDVLIDAMDIIVNQYNIKNIILYQIGGGQTGNDTQALIQKTKDLKLDNFIKWLGVRNDVNQLLTKGDIYIQPSRSEGIPLSIMEACLANLPIIATNVGGIPEVAIHDKNALLVPSNDAKSLAEAIITLHKEKDLRVIYGKNGRAHVLTHFCLNTQVKKLINDYYNL